MTALLAIRTERARQDALRASGRIPFTCAEPVDEAAKLAILLKQVSDVATALSHGGDVRRELVQVAAVADAWIDARSR